MISNSKKAVLLTLLCSFFLSTSAWAQFGNMNRASMAHNYEITKAKGKDVKHYLGYSIGVGKPFTTATFEHRFTDIRNVIVNSNDHKTISLGEKVITRNPKVSGIHLNANTYYRLAELSENTILAFNFGTILNILKYDVGEIRPTEISVYEYDMSSFQMGFPLCLDYKYGGEAVYNKSQKTSFTLGVGVAPILYANVFGNYSNTRADIRPFLRAEVGIFAGIEWRLTGSVLAGNSHIMNFKPDGRGPLGHQATVSVHSTPTYSISLSLMPFSYDWESFGW